MKGLIVGKLYSSFMNEINEIGFSGRSIRNTDPIQYQIRGILSGDFDLKKTLDIQPDNIKQRMIRDLNDITQGVLPLWMPQKFKMPKRKRDKLIKALGDYVK
jgi:hypothetical protein|tara:strand:+ start:90 stop:395 length:306 start_codon:yes stop_codon:yes gene_type:complete